MDSDLAAFGIEREEVEKPEEEDLLIYPENWASVQVFWALGNCWRFGEMSGRRLGINRNDIESTLRLMRIKRKRHSGIFDDLRVMESAALEALNEKKP